MDNKMVSESHLYQKGQKPATYIYSFFLYIEHYFSLRIHANVLLKNILHANMAYVDISYIKTPGLLLVIDFTFYVSLVCHRLKAHRFGLHDD